MSEKNVVSQKLHGSLDGSVAREGESVEQHLIIEDVVRREVRLIMIERRRRGQFVLGFASLGVGTLVGLLNLIAVVAGGRSDDPKIAGEIKPVTPVIIVEKQAEKPEEKLAATAPARARAQSNANANAVTQPAVTQPAAPPLPAAPPPPRQDQVMVPISDPPPLPQSVKEPTCPCPKQSGKSEGSAPPPQAPPPAPPASVDPPPAAPAPAAPPPVVSDAKSV